MKKGFTLIELMIVIVIIAILAAVVIPNLFMFLDRGSDSGSPEIKINITEGEKVIVDQDKNGKSRLPENNDQYSGNEDKY